MRRIMKVMKTAAITLLAGTWLASSTAYGITPGQEIGSVMGGGNFSNGSTTLTNQLQALNEIGAGMTRVNMYPNYYYLNNAPTPEVLDAFMLQAYQQSITPMILFEYYGSYANTGTPLGDYGKWYNIGQAFAERFQPNGTWAQANGISDWGITVYSAMNEPDVENVIPKDAYRDALEGLADGIHSVDADLKAIPGGFSRQNSHSDYTLRGYGPAIAGLLNNGKLDGIDLHTYFDVQFAPMDGMYKFSAQSNFDSVKRISGITADINFYSTEFNYKRRVVTEEEAAKGFLTAIWDSLGVVKNDGQTSATQFAFPWSLFKSQTVDPVFGLHTSLSPWVPTARGATLELVIEHTNGMSLVSADPLGAGEYVLSGNGKKMWVWQNRPFWTNHPGTSYTVSGIPSNAYKLEVIGWDGLRQTLPLSGETSYTISNLAEKETYMVIAYEDPDIPVLAVEGITEGGSYTDSVTPAITANDAGSGLAGVSVLLDGQPWSSGTPIESPGAHKLEVTAVDRVGNAEVRTVHFSLYGGTALSLSSSSAKYGETANLQALLTDTSGLPLSGETVRFTVAGYPAGQAVTDAAGTAAIAYPIQGEAWSDSGIGEYGLEAAYLQNETGFRRASDARGVLAVSKAEARIRYTGASSAPAGSQVVLAAKVERADGVEGHVEGLPVGFGLNRLNADGTWVSVSVTDNVYRTNEEGEASFQTALPASFYRVQAKLAYNDYYGTAVSESGLVAYESHSASGTANGWAGIPDRESRDPKKLHLEAKWEVDASGKASASVKLHVEPKGVKLELRSADWIVQTSDTAFLQGKAYDRDGEAYTVRLAFQQAKDHDRQTGEIVSATVWKGDGETNAPELQLLGAEWQGSLDLRDGDK